jgi:hypothetical protein
VRVVDLDAPAGAGDAHLSLGPHRTAVTPIEAVMEMKRKTASATTRKRTVATQPPTARSSGRQAAQASRRNAESLLKADHRKVEQLFERYGSTSSSQEKLSLARQICTELIVHTTLEEEIFYPACRKKAVEHEALDEAQVEHDSAKVLIGELMSESPDREFYDAKVNVLSAYIKHHVDEEERSSDGIFARARAAKVDMDALGQRLQSRKQELLSSAETRGLHPPQPRTLGLRPFADRLEARAVDRRRDRDRDEQGRFTRHDDDRSHRGRCEDSDWHAGSRGHPETPRRGSQSRD